MAASMTGFGRAEIALDGRSAAVEARSVNHRHLVVKWRLPQRLNGMESRLEEVVRESIVRGSLEVRVELKSNRPAAARVDLELAKRYGAAIREIDPTAVIDWASVFELPGVVDSATDAAPDEGETELVERALAAALAELVAMRRKEGSRLAAELEALIVAAEGHVRALAARAAGFPALAKQRLLQRLGELLQGGAPALDPAVLEREAALLADRADVREEIARLASHFAGFREKLASAAAPRGAANSPRAAIGRALEFQVQEMGREANTIGSKMQDAEATRSVVELKTAIERLREQVQNVE